MTLSYLPPDAAFLEPEREPAFADTSARAVVIPFGLEATVSYGAGTSEGPAAILAASHQLELFDEELWREPYRDFGIATLAQPTIAASLPAAMTQLEGLVGSILDVDRFPMILGGEHALTAGAIRPFARKYDDLAVLHVDAHADLRDGYLGEHYSHASAMRRVLDQANVSLVSVGIRAISLAEADYYQANRDRITIHWAKDQADWDIDSIVEPLRGRPVYISFDVDGLDCSLMPATGTPTPGGLDYWQALTIIRRAAEVGRIVGADVVELAPIPGLHAADYTAAAVAYKIMSYALSGTEPRS